MRNLPLQHFLGFIRSPVEEAVVLQAVLLVKVRVSVVLPLAVFAVVLHVAVVVALVFAAAVAVAVLVLFCVALAQVSVVPAVAAGVLHVVVLLLLHVVVAVFVVFRHVVGRLPDVLIHFAFALLLFAVFLLAALPHLLTSEVFLAFEDVVLASNEPHY